MLPAISDRIVLKGKMFRAEGTAMRALTPRARAVSRCALTASGSASHLGHLPPSNGACARRRSPTTAAEPFSIR